MRHLVKCAGSALVLGILATVGCSDGVPQEDASASTAPLSVPSGASTAPANGQTRISVCFYARDRAQGFLPNQCAVSQPPSDTCGNVIWPAAKTGGYQATQDIPLWLTQTWERVANVRFTYGGYTWDQSRASTQSAIVCANDGNNLTGNEQIKVLLTNEGGGSFGIKSGGNTSMDRTTAMHEFGHALGFTHEHDRGDRPYDMNCGGNCGPGQSCPLTQCPGSNGSAGWPDGSPTKGVLGPFDKNSIMAYQLCGRNSNNSGCWMPGGNVYWNRDNYGNEMRNKGQNDGFLSPGDVAAVRSMYGKNGSDYSTWLFGCLTAPNNWMSTSGDADCDGVFDIHDNCPWAANPGQEESLNDGVGDACSDPASAPFDTGPPAVTNAQGRRVALHATDNWSMAWATLDNGAPGDRVWLDQVWDTEKNQSPNAGQTWVTNTAWATIASGTSTRTRMRSLNMPAGQAVVDPVRGGAGKLRACASNAATPGAITCTQWYGEDPSFAQTDQLAQYEQIVGTGGTRWILLHVSPADGTAWASIQGAVSQGDEVYLNRYDWDYNRPAPADVTVPANVTTLRTPMRFIRAHSTHQGWVQACAKVVGNATPVCTGWYGPV